MGVGLSGVPGSGGRVSRLRVADHDPALDASRSTATDPCFSCVRRPFPMARITGGCELRPAVAFKLQCPL